MDTKKLTHFLEIVKCGSIKKASEKIGVDQSTLSRSLKVLETELGHQLYIHYDKSFQLTKTGDVIVKYAERFLNIYSSLKDSLSTLVDNPQGKLNLVASNGFIHFYFLQTLREFSEKNPNILLSAKTNDLNPSLSVGVDICIGPRIDDDNVISIPLYSHQLKMFASQNYLKKKGHPKEAADLDNHDLISYSQDLSSATMDFDWHLRYGGANGVARTPSLEITSSYALLRAAEMDLGIITFSDFFVHRDSPYLVDIFPKEGVKIQCYFSYRKNQESFWALTVYRDYLLNFFQTTENLV